MFVVKECSKCKEYKLLEDFSKQKNAIFGFHAYCKRCKYYYGKKYYELNLLYFKDKNREHQKINSEKIKQRKKNWRENNKNKISQQNKRWKEQNKEYLNLKIKNKRDSDCLFKLTSNIRNLIRGSLNRKRYKKNTRTYEILGCEFEIFKLHIEKQFTKGMTWDNYGEWHFDHIYPVSLAKDEQHVIELNHYTNFQPLWAKDNLSKGNKILEKQLFLL
jgi:hypothetical protein